MTDESPLEFELHSYVDGALDDEAMTEIEHYLKAHPESAAKVRDYLQQKAQIRAFSQAAAATAPSRPIEALEKQLTRRLKRRSLLRWPRVAVLAALFLAGWFGHMAYVPLIEGPRYTDEIIQAHLLASMAPLQALASIGPLESASVSPEIAPLFSLIGEPERIPDLLTLGLRPVAARVLPSDEGPVLHLIYQDADGTLVSYFLLHDDRAAEVPRHVLHRQGLTLVYWQHDRSRYAVAAPLADEQIKLIADLVEMVDQI